jgi:hypothetical protein
MNSIKKKFWDAAPIATGGCLDNLQHCFLFHISQLLFIRP